VHKSFRNTRICAMEAIIFGSEYCNWIKIHKLTCALLCGFLTYVTVSKWINNIWDAIFMCAIPCIFSNNNSMYPTKAHSLLCKILYRFANMFRSRGIIIRASHTMNIAMLLYTIHIRVLFSMWLCYKCIVCTRYMILKMLKYHSCPPCAFCVVCG
jgi:hypothetical protein